MLQKNNNVVSDGEKSKTNHARASNYHLFNIPNYVQASTITNTSTETTASVPELSVVLILGLMVILTVFIALVRLRIDSKALKFGNTSNRI
jgi:hypothetical protein